MTFANICILERPARFHCEHCGPTNQFMEVTSDEGDPGAIYRSCIPCNPTLAQAAARMPHTKPPLPTAPQVA